MLTILYILVIVQIALGIYSLWDGFQWLRMVRQRLSSHTGFYTPVVALICPCKGAEPGIEANLAGLTRFDYPNYEVFLSFASGNDPAFAIGERVKSASKVPVHLIIAGTPVDCGEKISNLRAAVENLPEKFEIVAFTDSDVRPSRAWLRKLVAPLQDPRIGATTTYRWIIPSRSVGSGGFASALASAWNGSIATLLGRPRENFCWGGGTAMHQKTFRDANVLDAWNGAVSDDFTLTDALVASRRPILFCPECLAPTTHPWTIPSLLEFTNRQILITRVYSFRRWVMGAAAHLGYILTLLYAAIFLVVAIVRNDPWFQPTLMMLVIPLLAATKGAIRTLAVTELLPEWKSQINQWSWVWTTLAPVVPFLFVWNFIASLFNRRIRWRNISYELVSPHQTRILKR